MPPNMRIFQAWFLPQVWTWIWVDQIWFLWQIFILGETFITTFLIEEKSPEGSIKFEPKSKRIEIKLHNFYCGIHHVVHFADVMSSAANEAKIAELRFWHVKNVVSSAVPSSVLLYTHLLLARFSFPFQINKVNITLRAPLGVNVDRPQKDF